MIASLRGTQREDVALFERGLYGWFRGQRSENTIAAGRNFCETLVVLRERATKG